jgi:hypothetical protein
MRPSTSLGPHLHSECPRTRLVHFDCLDDHTERSWRLLHSLVYVTSRHCTSQHPSCARVMSTREWQPIHVRSISISRCCVVVRPCACVSTPALVGKLLQGSFKSGVPLMQADRSTSLHHSRSRGRNARSPQSTSWGQKFILFASAKNKHEA